jgi:hypothetical protein
VAIEFVSQLSNMKNINGWRTKLPRRLAFTVATIVLSVFGADVYACQCREREPPCAQYRNADVVFVGSVVTITLAGLGPERKVNFSIERVVKGLSGSVVELVSSGSSCDYDFTERKRYLVYAYRDSKRKELYTHHCTRTTEVSNASSDLAFFNLTSKKLQPSQIVGVLADNQKRLRDVRIVASSGGRLYRTTSNKEGWFRLNVPHPAKYKVRILLPLYADVGSTTDETELNKIMRVRTRTGVIIEYEVVVESNGCAFVNPPLFIDYLEYQKHSGRYVSR